ncbi:hypothetical protein ACFL1G_06600 [Planctomycetota bacterium]
MNRQLVFQTCITVLLLAGPWLIKPALAGLVWDINTVDSTGYVGAWTSIALDANDNPHISYQDITNYALKYAAFNGSTWDIETVASEGYLGMWQTIALDADGNPHISYQDDTNNALKYAAFNSSTWDIVTVDRTGNVGSFTSIALDANDNPHISYCDETNVDLKYAKAYHCGDVLAGDFNGDCIVDSLDLQTFANNCWLTIGPEDDLYVDGWVDFNDFAVLANNWLIDCDQTPENPACVPK